ncbi:ABC transporter ATP-binding protein/permease [Oceaniovalibus sp. ACAM 378]|uniref:ABC transporter ATP-binding protein/permease n=1 Tax=Oceaniovalibus sp. ACAM 378 TaxID=2599923 RepID=UPI0011D3E6D2|nr:ATP-binding cassette domain-containing protein [Oceaniovalibus sp. ACAM 378]TYB87936.1 ATP-binding cassette domain-containing protein [Oceaniovalibus sp. ACAM 378]
MTTTQRQENPTARQRAQARIIMPVARPLRIAGALSVIAGLIWPFQAAALAWAISGWVAGHMDRTGIAALVFVFGGVLRAGLDHLAGGYLFEAADQTISRERAALIGREARARANASSAEVAALIVQKLPLLQPWITRYHVAMVRVSVLPAVLLALTFWYSWVAGLVLLVAGPLIPVFMALVGKAAEDESRRQMDEIGSMNAMLMDRLSAMLDIRLLGAAERAAADFGGRAEALRIRTMAVLRIAFLSSTVLEFFSAVGVAMVAVFVGFTLLGAIRFGSWGTPLGLDAGIFLLLIAPEFFQPFRDLAAAWHDRAAGLSVVADLDALDAADRVAFVGLAEAASPMTGPLALALSGTVVALPGRKVVLPDLRLRAPETLALTGPSGAGKSTALAAIAGLVPLSAGAISVCGHSLDHSTADAWRARITLIPQAPHFPDQTLRDWLDPDGGGTDPWPALRQAEAAGIVQRLRAGLDTRLGESGGGVSGGEARRLMIARAILSGRELILADEPTADLDPETAAQVIRALVRLKDDGHSLIVATHDPVLAAAMDRSIEVRA